MRPFEKLLLACHYQGEMSREVVDVKDIISVIGMVPLPMNHGASLTRRLQSSAATSLFRY